MLRFLPVRCLSYRIRISADDSYFVAYHPDVEHDYKFTKPFPKKEAIDRESVLKVDSKNMITKSPNLEQIQSLSYTPRRYWIQYQGREKRRKYQESFNDNVDRPGLTS